MLDDELLSDEGLELLLAEGRRLAGAAAVGRPLAPGGKVRADEAAKPKRTRINLRVRADKGRKHKYPANRKRRAQSLLDT